MICPQCQTPNPEGAERCIRCTSSFSDFEKTEAGSSETALPTMTPSPSSEGRSGSGASVSAVLSPGAEIGRRYQVVKLLGRGGMGAVYRVHDRELDRDVALKLIRSDLAENPAVLERFKREIQLSSEITHKHVLRVYDLGESEGVKFLTMQFVEGEDLSTLIRREGQLPVGRIVEIFRQICQGLAEAHEKGVIHRDLKPQNVMIDASGDVYLTDFGLAKSLELSGMTETGAVMGTPSYMSPEQVKGDPVDARSDIYSLGVMLYEMAAGRVPFSGGSVYQVMMQRLQKPPQAIGEINAAIPAYLRKILDRCMAIEPAARYQTVDEVLADLDSATFHSSLRYTVRGKRRWLLPAAGVAAIAILIAAGLWIYQRGRAAHPSSGHKPESVLVADFANKTGDGIFDGTLEPAFTLALEGASFINSFSRNQARQIAAELKPGATGLDESVARLVAVREGIDVVTGGEIARKGDGYDVSVRAVDAVTGKTITKADEEVSGKDGVLSAVAKLAANVRSSLGDTTPESAQLAAAETFTAGSLEAAHVYAVAQEEQYAGKYDDAIRDYKKATELDPKLGRAYAGVAVIDGNLGRRDEAEKYFALALSHIDRMTDREKYRTRGAYYLIVRRDPDRAIAEYSQLVQKYPADTAGISNLALCYFYKRDMARALSEGRRAIAIYPKNVPQVNNVGLYAMYAGDFKTAVEEQTKVLSMNPSFILGYVGMALSQLGQGHPDEAAATYQKLEALGPRGASAAQMGLADVALYQGRAADAAAILEKGIAADLAAKDPDAAAAKLVALGQAKLELGDGSAAFDASRRAVALVGAENIAFPAARIAVETGHPSDALKLAASLGKSLEADPRAYAKLIEGEVKLKAGDARSAIQDFEDAAKIADTWMGHYDLGRAYLAAGMFTEADAELETCIKRRGEATAVFLNEVPSYRLFPPVYYDLGRAQQGLKSPAASQSFKAFLDIKARSAGGPLVADARKRLAMK